MIAMIIPGTKVPRLYMHQVFLVIESSELNSELYSTAEIAKPPARACPNLTSKQVIRRVSFT